MKDYQKVLLYAYPKLGRIAEDIGQIVRAKACASVMGERRRSRARKNSSDTIFCGNSFCF